MKKARLQCGEESVRALQIEAVSIDLDKPRWMVA